MKNHRYCYYLIAILLWLLSSAGYAANPPRIAIVIDDLGNNWQNDLAVIQLPAAVTCAILPHTRYTLPLAQLAFAAHHAVIVHLPMQALDGQYPGPGELTSEMNQQQFAATLTADLASVPFAEGVNNHMGSLLTEQPQAMAWLMQALQTYHYFFLDSRTTAHSVAMQQANQAGIATIGRDIFLDDQRDYGAIAQQLQALVKLAKTRGYAVAIGHPYPVTLAVLQAELPQLTNQGIVIVPLDTLVPAPAGSAVATKGLTKAGSSPLKPEA